MSDAPDNNEVIEGVSEQATPKVRRSRKSAPQETVPFVPPIEADSNGNGNGNGVVPKPVAKAGQISAAKAPIEFDRWLWRNFIPEGAFVVLSGAGGVGKSSLVAYILSGLSNGTLEGNFADKPQNSIWYSREDSTTVSLTGKLVAGEADLDRIILMDQNGAQGAAVLKLPADLEKLAQEVEDNHYKIVVLDLLMSFVETKRSLHQNYGNVVQVFSKIAEMCASKKVTVIGIMHNKTGSKEASADAVVSSLAIPGVARHVLMTGDLGDTGLKVLGTVKSNISKTMTGYVYAVKYVDVARDPETGEPKLASKIEMRRPATRHEVAACLEKPKSLADATPQIRKLLEGLAVLNEEDGTYAGGPEQATKTDLYPKVREALGGVKMRRFQDIVADALSIGVIDSRVDGHSSNYRNLVRINRRGLMLINPVESDMDVHDDDDEPGEASFDGFHRPQAEVIYEPDGS